MDIFTNINTIFLKFRLKLLNSLQITNTCNAVFCKVNFAKNFLIITCLSLKGLEPQVNNDKILVGKKSLRYKF